MKNLTRLFWVSSTLIATFSIYVFAEENKKNKLQIIMQNLLQDTQNILEGMILEDYKLIYESADRIASHPTPGIAIQVKLLKNMGGDLSTFKNLDGYVHDRAIAVREASKIMDKEQIFSEYTKLLNGCLSCHTQYKTKVSNIINK